MKNNKSFRLMNHISRKYKIGKLDFIDNVKWIDRFADICAQDGIYDFEIEGFLNHVLKRELKEKEVDALKDGVRMGRMTREIAFQLER